MVWCTDAPPLVERQRVAKNGRGFLTTLRDVILANRESRISATEIRLLFHCLEFASREKPTAIPEVVSLSLPHNTKQYQMRSHLGIFFRLRAWAVALGNGDALQVTTRLDRRSLVCFASTGSNLENGQSINKTTSFLGDERDVRIQIPPHPHGYRIFPFSWDELQDIVDTDLSRLCRSVEQQAKYEVYKINLQRSWNTVQDHILCSKFGIPPKIHSSSGRQEASDPKNLPPDFPKLSLLPNDFPYFVKEPIQHWVLWKLGGQCNNEDIDWAKAELLRLVGPIRDYIHWVNPPHLKSVSEVDHVHLLCLPVTRVDQGRISQLKQY